MPPLANTHPLQKITSRNTKTSPLPAPPDRSPHPQYLLHTQTAGVPNLCTLPSRHLRPRPWAFITDHSSTHVKRRRNVVPWKAT